MTGTGTGVVKVTIRKTDGGYAVKDALTRREIEVFMCPDIARRWATRNGYDVVGVQPHRPGVGARGL